MFAAGDGVTRGRPALSRDTSRAAKSSTFAEVGFWAPSSVRAASRFAEAILTTHTQPTYQCSAQIGSLAVDTAGNAIAMWAEAGSKFHWNHYDVKSDAWRPDAVRFEILHATLPVTSTVTVDLDGRGDGYAIYELEGAVWRSRFSNGGFAEPTALVPARVYSPKQVIDRGGQSLVFWVRDRAIRVAGFLSDGQPTGLESLIEEGDAGPQGGLQVNGSSGRAVVIWRSSSLPGYKLGAAHCDILGDGGCTPAALLANTTLNMWAVDGPTESNCGSKRVHRDAGPDAADAKW